VNFLRDSGWFGIELKALGGSPGLSHFFGVVVIDQAEVGVTFLQSAIH
jgi:hypothetical protein